MSSLRVVLNKEPVNTAFRVVLQSSERTYSAHLPVSDSRVVEWPVRAEPRYPRMASTGNSNLGKASTVSCAPRRCVSAVR